MLGEIAGGVAIDRVPFRRRRASFGNRNVMADVLEAGGLGIVEPARAKPVGADQRAVHDEVGVAPDRARVKWA